MASGRGLPSVLRTQTYERPVQQDITTDILYPVSINQKQAKWILDRKGVLDSNSAIILRQTCNQVGGVDMDCYLPTSTGILGAISRAYLTIGGRRVSNLESVGHWATWKRLHWSDEYMNKIKEKIGGKLEGILEGMKEIHVELDNNGYPIKEDKKIELENPIINKQDAGPLIINKIGSGGKKKRSKSRKRYRKRRKTIRKKRRGKKERSIKYKH